MRTERELRDRLQEIDDQIAVLDTDPHISRTTKTFLVGDLLAEFFDTNGELSDVLKEERRHA